MRISSATCAVVSSLATLIISGCCSMPSAEASKPVSLKLALVIIENDLYQAGVVSLTNIDSAVPDGGDVIKNAIAQAQCVSNSSNPIIPVFSGPFSIALQGSITQAGAVNPTLSATPSLGFSYTVTQGQQQQLTAPIAFVSVSGLPNFYMGQSLLNLNNMPDEDKKEYVSAIKQNVTHLQALVEEQIQKYPAGMAELKKKGCVVAPFTPSLQ